jgi:hypothetical protein
VRKLAVSRRSPGVLSDGCRLAKVDAEVEVKVEVERRN